MRQFYMMFPKCDALRSELSWTHYRSLMRVNDETVRNFHIEETVKSGVKILYLPCEVKADELTVY